MHASFFLSFSSSSFGLMGHFAFPLVWRYLIIVHIRQHFISQFDSTTFRKWLIRGSQLRLVMETVSPVFLLLVKELANSVYILLFF